MRKTIVILGVLALAAVPLFGQWHSDTRISNTSDNSYTPYSGGWNIAANDADVHIAWQDYTYYPYYVRYVDFPIGNPPAAGSGEAVSTYYGSEPVIAIHNGERFVTWYYYTSPYYLHTRERNGSWGPVLNHGVYYSSCYYPATATDDDGNLHCVFNRSYDGYRVYYQRKNSGSGSFTSPVQVYDPGSYRYAYRPSICITSDGVIHVSVGHNNGYRLIHAWSSNNGASWNSETIGGTNETYYIYPTSICSDSEDNLYIAYPGRNYPQQIFVRTNAGGSWSSRVNVSQHTSYCHDPSICCDTFGGVWVVWHDRRSGSDYQIIYNHLAPGADFNSGWDGPAQLSSSPDDCYRPKIAADEQGNVHICWFDSRDGNYEIYYNWYKGTAGGGGRDLACTRILKPLGKITGDPITPSAVIANFGGGPDSGYAMCVITGPGVNYDKGDLEGIVYLDAGEEDAVSFPSWTPPGGAGDKYRVEVTVYLWPERTTEDDDPANNTKVEYATIESAVQVDPIEVAKPEEGSVVDSMTPAATFKNIGTEAATDFYCYCEIVSVAYHTADYADSVAVAGLDPEETTNIEFAPWICDDDAPYIATFFAAIPGEPDRTLLGIEWPVPFQGTPLVGVAESADALRIEVTGPNPFRSGTLVSYAVPYPISTTIRVYDATGKAVRTLHDGELSGEGTLYWNGSDDTGRELGRGLYFIRIATSGFTRTAKVVLLH
jgi:hypothetical protein